MKKQPSLLVDGMLGSLARKLRLYGFDTLYFNDKDDLELVKMAEEEGRILVSSDKALVSFATAKGLKAVEVNGKDDLERLSIIFLHLNYLPALDPEKSRCPACNGEITSIKKEEVQGKIPESIIERYDRFFACSKCRKIYWKGGHWKRLSTFHSRLEEKMKNYD